MATVIGIFDNDSDLEVASNRLYERGFKDVRVVNRENEGAQLPPAGAFVQGNGGIAGGSMATGSGGYIAPMFVPGFFGLADDAIDSTYLTENLDMELDEDEANFYANAVRKGGKLLIVEADGDEADVAWSIMRNSNGTQFVKAV